MPHSTLPQDPLPQDPLPNTGPTFPEPPAGSSGPIFEPPAGDDPRTSSQPPTPATPIPAPPPPIPTPQNPDGFEFTPPDQKRAQAHAEKLRAAPTDAALHGYPTDLVTRARAEVALEPGTKPALVLFYDDSARASNLQAAELLPLLVRLRETMDVIPIDVAASSALSAAEKKLVRTYYMAYVPTTVVLAANRKPILLQYQRVSAAVVEAALVAK